jgi:pyridoxine kinase
MAGYGKVALSAMIPIFSRMNYETFCLPTALISNTLSYGDFKILDTTEYMEGTIQVWERLGFEFPAVCTGYIASEKQADLVNRYCRKLKEKGSVVIVDPIMADDGVFYNGISEKIVHGMRKLCSVAEVILPNMTEACFLAGTDYRDQFSKDGVKKLTDSLLDLGPRNVIITSCRIDGQTCTVVRTSGDTDLRILRCHLIPASFPGTGDIFTSIVAGDYLQGRNLTDSAGEAMKLIEKLIAANQKNIDKDAGIPVEYYLDLIQRL